MRQFLKIGLGILLFAVGAWVATELITYSIKTVVGLLYLALTSPKETFLLSVALVTLLGIYLEFKN